MRRRRSYRRVPGDNSMLILLFSVVTLASLALLFAVWRLNLKSAWLLEQKAARHEPSPVSARRCAPLWTSASM